MKIGVDIRTLMDFNYSGVPEYTLNLIQAILKLDTENEYKLFYNSWKDNQNIPKFKQKNVEIIRTKYPNKIFNYIMQNIIKHPDVYDIIGEIDCFLMPHLNFISLTGKSKNILVVHDLSFLRFREFFSLRKNIWHKAINAKKLVKNFDKIISVSENTKNDIIDLCGVDKDKVEVIYSGVSNEYEVKDLNQEKVVFEKITNKYDLPEKFILYLGTLEPRKNIVGIIKAYNKFRNRNNDLQKVKLVLAGGTGWKAKNIFKEWKKSKYKDDIFFLGYVDREDKVYLYNLAQIFVYPSFYEGFGFPPLEAMACGTPVVSGDNSSLSEVVGDAAITVDSYNEYSISLAIENILKDNEIKEEMIAKGLIKAKEFDWKKTAKNFLNIITSLA